MNPSIPNELKSFRGRANSEDYNKFTRRTFFDITQLCNIANQLELEVKWLQEVAGVSEHITQARIALLKERIELLEQQITPAGNFKSIVPAHMMSSDPDSTTPALIDTTYGVATIVPAALPVSKLYLKDLFTGEVILPKSLNMVIDPPAGENIQDTDLRHCITADGFNLWRRKVIRSASTVTPDGAIARLVIDLPESIITNQDINCITIAPYPLGMLDITNIEYNTGGAWAPIPGFQPIDDANNCMFSFPVITIRQLAITFRQRYALPDGAKRAYYLGARKIGIYNYTHKLSTGDLIIPFKLKDTGPHKITAIEPIFTNANTLSDQTIYKRNIFSYTINEVDAEDNLIPAAAPAVVVIGDKIVLKATIHRDPINGVIPTLQSVRLSYEPV